MSYKTSTNNKIIDLVIIGAGPAGLNAAVLANKNKLSCILIDEQHDLGGQIYRSIKDNIKFKNDFLGDDYYSGIKLYKEFIKSNIIYWKSTVVWQISKEKEVYFVKDNKTGVVKANFILICCGAIERPMPISGWTLPGVISVGGGQTLLKSSSMGVDDAVFVGSGPLLYLTAYQYLKAGFSIRAVLDTTDIKQIVKATFFLLPAFLNLRMIFQGFIWIKFIRKHCEFIPFVKKIKIHGKNNVSSISLLKSNNKKKVFEIKNVFIHQGVIPNINLTMATGINHHWNSYQYCWVPTLNSFGETNLDGIYIAGDNMRIGGVKVSSTSSQLAVLDILGKLNRGFKIKKFLYFIKNLFYYSIRPFLDILFKPSEDNILPEKSDDIVCRCENITKSELYNSINLNVSDPNQLKAYSRAGMGKCQGRYCGLTVQAMIAKKNKIPISKVGYYNIRPPIKPITLSELASLEKNHFD